MTRFNKPNSRTATMSPVVAEKLLGLTTHEGAQGFKRDPRGELFMLGAGRFFGEAAFYESAHQGAARFRWLVHDAAAVDPVWVAEFLKWLRTEANIRTAAIVGAVEFVRSMQRPEAAEVYAVACAHGYTARAVVRSVLQRADEPGEMIAYYRSTYGRSIPIAMKRGIADAMVGHETGRKPLYSEYTLLKYDTESHGYRFGDVVDTVCPTTWHPAVRGTLLGDLFEYAIDRRHGHADDSIGFPMLEANRKVRNIAEHEPAILLDPERLKTAGLTWEDALSIGGAKLDKAALWEALIDADALGYMALIRNLRNFDEAGISKAHARKVAEIIEDPARVQSSRQLPFRYLSAYHAAPSDRWKQPLTEALDHSTANIPRLTGRTLVLVDTSASMEAYLSGKSRVRYVDAAALFGVALARAAAKVDLYGFGDSVFRHELAYGGSVLGQTQLFVRRVGEAGHGTRIAESMQRTYAKHDRVVIFTDMQTMGRNAYTYGYGIGDVSGAVPPDVPVYAWNLAGYEASMMPTGSGNRHEFGGFSDSAFSIMQTLEAGRDGRWPWE
jgi:hypothetical protein